MSTSVLGPSIQGVVVEQGDGRSGRLRVSARTDPADVLADRLASDGYLFLPGFHDAGAVAAARAPMVLRLAAAGLLHPAFDPDDLVARPDVESTWLDGLTDANTALHEVLYGRSTLDFFDALLGEPTRHYDFTWSRAVSAGQGTAPHCDVVFMGRGTPCVVTMWTAMCDIPEAVGGLCVLEGSHRDHDALRAYRSFDVDTYCENLDEQPTASLGRGGSFATTDPNALQTMLSGRWLWNDYRAGDVLVFGLGTMHASLDNRSDRLRISTDTRYQCASEPIDARWVGCAPIGHSLAAQEPRIC